MESTSDNLTCMEGCFQNNKSTDSPLQLNMTARDIWSSREQNDLIKGAAILTEVFEVLFSSVFRLANWFGINPIVFICLSIGTLYLMWKTIVPLNYIMDLDIPGFSYKRRDLVNLQRQLRKFGKTVPPPYPNGWYSVIESDELGVEQVKHVDCFGESLAVFRSSNGQVHILDAYCPHLGANMAMGGTVKGDCLECPFHKWRFSGPSGKCVGVPNLDTVPKTASVRTWDCREMDGNVFVWYSAENAPPIYELPVVEEIKRGEWRYMGRNEFLVPCHVQDIPENGADLAHLNAIHGNHLMAGKSFPLPEFFNIFGIHHWSGMWAPTDEPYSAAVEIHHQMKIFGKFSFMNIDVTAKQIGPSYVQIWMRHKLCNFVILQTVTPMTPMMQKVIHRIYAPWILKPVANLVLYSESVMFHRDLAIWSSKEYVNQPILVKTDKCLKAYKNWFRQFYSEHSISFEDAMKRLQNGGMDW